jgi:hypothetical protein
MPHAYPNFLNKGNDPLRMQVINYLSYLSVFINACENLVMADDVASPSNPLVALIKQEELEKTPFNVNVFQWSHEEKPSKGVVRTRTNHLAWDH